MAKKPVKKIYKTKSKPAPKKARKYEGASKAKRLSRWNAPATSANAETQTGLVVLRNRARDLRRNNPWASKGISVVTSNVVGDGIVTQFRSEADGSTANIEKTWASWAESTAIDFDGRKNIYGLQRLIMDAVTESGEVFLRRRYTAVNAFPLQYQVLESDFLDTNRTENGLGGNRIIQGIEFDPQGRRVAYYMFESHPGSFEQGAFGNTLSSIRISASEILHIFRMDRPGQARGITWLAPCMVRLKDFDDYEDAQLLRQKIAACFTAFVQDIDASIADAEDDCDETELGDKVEPGLIEHLPPGKTIEFTNPPAVQGYDEYTTRVLSGIAAGLGVTYESLSGDYSKVNYSSGRLGWIEMGRNIKAWRDDIMLPHVLNPISIDFLKTAAILGERTEGIFAVHVPPKREMIDPTKEIPATVDAIRAGLTTLSDEILAQGKDPKVLLKQYAEDMKKLDDLKIKVESDARNPKGTGATEEAPVDSGGTESGQAENQNSRAKHPRVVRI